MENIALYKLLLPFSKLIFTIGGWFAGLLILFGKPEEVVAKERRYRLIVSIIAVPMTMSIDNYMNLNKWALCIISILFAYFGWLVLDIVKNRLPDVLNKYIDKKID